MPIFAYVYSYKGDEIHGGGMNTHDYLSLSARPGIYYRYKSVWKVLKVTNFGSFTTLHREEVPNEVKIHHLLTQ